MPIEAFSVECILRAERIKLRNGSVKWAYRIKWRNSGHFNTSREDESHPCFQQDSSVLKEFWASTGFNPDDYDYIGAIIEPPTAYVENCRRKSEITSTNLSPSPTLSSEYTSIPENNSDLRGPQIATDTQNTADDWDSLFDDSDYLNKTLSPTLKHADPQGVHHTIHEINNISGPSLATDKNLDRQGDNSDDCDSLFGDSGYVSPSTSLPLRLAQVTNSQGAHSQSAALPPQRKEGMLGPRVVSVATFDKKTGQLVTRKRKQRTLDFQNPPGEERQLLPLAEVFGPPELGIVDDDLYVPHNTTVTTPVNNESHELHSAEMAVDKEVTLTSTTRNVNASVDAMDIDSPQPKSISSHVLDAPEPSQNAIPDGHEFNLALGDTEALPLVLKDVPWGTFNPLRSSRLNLQVHGSYAHSDIQSIIGDWRKGEICNTARVCLQDCGVINKYQKRWKTLHDELFRKELCLIVFLSNAPDALVMFSSQSRSFGKVIGARGRLLGWANTMIICSVTITSRSVPFDKQSCGSMCGE